MNKAKTAKKYQDKIRLLPNGRYQIRVQGVNIMHSTIDAIIVNDLLLKSPLSGVNITQYEMKDPDAFWAYCKSVKPGMTQKNREGNVMANMRNMMDYAISSGKAQKNLFTEYEIHQDGNIRVFDSRIGRYCRELGIVRKSMHDLRRTFATMLYRNGMPPERLRVILGHTTTNQTLEYVIDYTADVDDFDSLNGLRSSSSESESEGLELL